MSDKLTHEELAQLIPSRSSILKKVPLETRRLLNRAIIYRNPVTYEGIYNKFDLESFGISYTAFYYYARRIHLAITTSELGKLRGDPHELISDAVAQTTLDVAAEPILAAKHLSHVARAYHDIERARAARIKANLAKMQEENWHNREKTRHQNRLELKALDLSNRITLEDRKAQHKKEIVELKAQLAATNPPLPNRERAGVRVRIPTKSGSVEMAGGEASRLNAAPKEEAAERVRSKQTSQRSPQRPHSAPSFPQSPRQPPQDSSIPRSGPAPRYGRHPDGRPRTRQEFLAILRPQVYEIYGIDPPKNWPPRPTEPRAPASDHERSESEPRPLARGHSASVSEQPPSKPRPPASEHEPGESDPRP